MQQKSVTFARIMKGIAIVWIGCLLLLNCAYLMETLQLAGEVDEMECCAACHAGCCNADEEHRDRHEACDSDQECPPDCDCSDQFQISAIAYGFIEPGGVVVQSYHYGLYKNSYTFEYSSSFLQPPRFG
jgi:hypothetical protein